MARNAKSFEEQCLWHFQPSLPWALTPPTVHSGLTADPGHLSQNCTEDFKIGFKTGCSPSRKISKGGGKKTSRPPPQSWEAHVLTAFSP